VDTALLVIDSQLLRIREGKPERDAERHALIDQFIESLGPKGAADVLDGACTLIYLFMKWLRLAHEEHDKDVIEYVVPGLVGTLRKMPQSIPPEAVPTMAGLVIAAASDLSPSLWRQQYGEWTDAEMAPLEATTFLLAEHINGIAGDPDFATRLITDALARADAEF
jgi:hypothetical protein